MATTLTAENKEYLPTRWETVGCPFCDATEGRLVERFGYQHRYQFLRCESCGLAYQNPRPAYNDDFIDTAYSVYSSSDGFRAQEGLSEQGLIVHREYSHILSEIESYVGKKGRILEIGCNTGFFCKAAADNGWYPVGVEVSRSMAELANRNYGVETHVGDWVKMDFGAPFDAVYCSHVIEHVPDPRLWMRRFSEVLKPNGIVCLSVPNYSSIDRRFKRFLKRAGLKKDRWAKWRTPDHLYEPCEKSMLSFVDKCGFDVLKMYSYPSEWTGEIDPWHSLFHMKLRWGAKSRYYLRPRARVS